MDSQSDLRNGVDALLHIFQQGYEPFVITAIRSIHGNSWLDVIKNTPDLRVNTHQQPLRLDATAIVRVMLHHWDSTFSRVLVAYDRNMLFEVRQMRNKWAHQGIITADDVDRLADNVTRLLVSINAPNSGQAKQFREEWRMQRYRPPYAMPIWMIGVVLTILMLGGVGWWVWGGANGAGSDNKAQPVVTTRTPMAPTTDSAFPCQQGQIKANPRTMIYHLPDGVYYAVTKNSDVQCFDSIDAVEAAGYRQAKR
ncbi:MAG: Swt1 family HEPN domain-containing protein [Roseiflexaceae bacterium]|jgi:hypothetical protein